MEDDSGAVLSSAMDMISSAFETRQNALTAKENAFEEEKEAMLADIEAKKKAVEEEKASMKTGIAEEKAAMLVEVEDEKKALANGIAALEAEKEAMKSHDTSDTDIIKVNVSGTHIDVSRRTFCQIEGSMLATKFSGRWEGNMKKDEDGRVFLNYDPDEFKLILKELRKCEINPLRRLKMPDPSLKDLWMFLGLPTTDFAKSTILLADAHKKAVYDMLPGAETDGVEVEMLYRFTRSDASDSSAAREFHKACDGKGATITVIRSSSGPTFNGYILGGYNPVSWSSVEGIVEAPGAFIFTVTNPAGTEPTKYMVKDAAHAVFNHPAGGPCFGSEHDASDDMYGTSDLGCRLDGDKSWTFFEYYEDTTGRGEATFTGAWEFDIETMEVWKVTELPR